MTSFPLVLNFPHHSNIFLTAFFSLIQSAELAALPESIKGTKATTTISAHDVCGEGGDSEFSSRFFPYFTSTFFLADFFS